MSSWLIWNPSTSALYEAEVETSSFEEVANRAAQRIYGGVYEEIIFKPYVSCDNGTTWSEHRFHIEKAPTIIPGGYTVNVSDPRPATKKIVL